MEVRIALCYRCEERDAHDLYTRLVPGGLLCIHGVLRRAGFESVLFNFSGWPWPDISRQLSGFAPNLVGVSHFTHNHESAMRLYDCARQTVPRALILGGGAQVTFLDEAILRRAPALDAVVRGEGEAAVLELAQRLAAGQPWQNVPSLTFRGDGGCHRTPTAPPMPHLDPCYPLERFQHTEGVNPEEQFPFLITSRGCPARCSFCDSPGLWGRPVRFRSVSGIIEEIRYLMRTHGLLYFGFRDDTFSLQRRRIRELCQSLRDDIPGILWNCQSRVDAVDAERLLWMRQAGCEQIQFGIESMSPEVLRMLGKSVPPERVHQALAWCRQVGIRTCAYLITGVPGQTWASLAPERRLFTHHGLQEGIVSPLCLYPGTALFAKMQAAGTVSDAIFLRGDIEQVKVRHDPQATSMFDRLCAFIAEQVPRNVFRADELTEHLVRTDRCVSALLNWGHFQLTQGDRKEAQKAFQEIRRRWPRHPWGHQGLADWAEASGRSREAERYRRAALRLGQESPAEGIALKAAGPLRT